MKRFTVPEMMELAARGLGKVDLLGARGASLVTCDEVEAMAGLLAIMRLTPVYPGQYVPPSQITSSAGARA